MSSAWSRADSYDNSLAAFAVTGAFDKADIVHPSGTVSSDSIDQSNWPTLRHRDGPGDRPSAVA